MSENWAEAIAERIAGTNPPLAGRFLLLGAADTGKTTLLVALANRLAQSQPVALVDADIAVGVIVHWRQEKTKGTIRAPQIDMQRVRCLTIGDARIAVPLGWS